MQLVRISNSKIGETFRPYYMFRAIIWRSKPFLETLTKSSAPTFYNDMLDVLKQ